MLKMATTTMNPSSRDLETGRRCHSTPSPMLALIVSSTRNVTSSKWMSGMFVTIIGTINRSGGALGLAELSNVGDESAELRPRWKIGEVWGSDGKLCVNPGAIAGVGVTGIPPGTMGWGGVCINGIMGRCGTGVPNNGGMIGRSMISRNSIHYVGFERSKKLLYKRTPILPLLLMNPSFRCSFKTIRISNKRGARYQIKKCLQSTPRNIRTVRSISTNLQSIFGNLTGCWSLRILAVVVFAREKAMELPRYRGNFSPTARWDDYIITKLTSTSTITNGDYW